MNHNYYYTLLGRRAGGPGTPVVSDCSESLQLRYATTTPGGLLVGTGGNTQADWEGLVYSGLFLEVWASTPLLVLGTQLYLDSAKTQEIQVDNGGFRIEENFFSYQTGVGVVTIDPIPQPSDNQIRISGPSPTSCQLNGPYTQTVWVARDQWQQVDRLWLDTALTQPFVGGGNWFHADDLTIPAAGTTLQVNNCGWVIGFYAC
jgi:hypothetical protein